MSDDSDSSDSGSSPPPETLIAGRAKRSTAGNRLSHLLQHLEDEDIKADLLADQEDDQKDYSASEDEDADVALDSSDDSDDEAKEAEDQDAGEKELRKQERVESSRKRKARELVRIQPMKKKVKIVDEATGQDVMPIVSKKPERINYIDLGATRQSSRSQTVANAKVTAAKLKESRRKAIKTQEVMRLAAEKKAAEAGPKLTQADRMARALEIEKENSRSLNRWEKSEQERLRIQQEKLEAMRNRKLEGPIYKYWSGPVTWVWREGPDGPMYKRCKYDRASKPKVEDMDDVENDSEEDEDVENSVAEFSKVNSEEPKIPKPQETEQSTTNEHNDLVVPESQETKNTETQPDTGSHDAVKPSEPSATEPLATEPGTQPTSKIESLLNGDVHANSTNGEVPDIKEEPKLNLDKDSEMAIKEEQPDLLMTDEGAIVPEQPIGEQSSFLEGIDSYASASNEKPASPSGSFPGGPSILVEDMDASMQELEPQSDAASTSSPPNHPLPSMPPYIHNPHHIKPPHPGSNLPLLRERAARSLLILDSFPQLGPAPTHFPRRGGPGPSAPVDHALSNLLLPDIHPQDLTPEQRRYVAARQRRGATNMLPIPPARAMCAVSGKKARFRDPKTRLPYADLAASKAIQRVLANGCQWSALLGVWAGIVGEGSLGRVARGVPEGFWTGKIKEEDKQPEVIDIS